MEVVEPKTKFETSCNTHSNSTTTHYVHFQRNEFTFVALILMANCLLVPSSTHTIPSCSVFSKMQILGLTLSTRDCFLSEPDRWVRAGFNKKQKKDNLETTRTKSASVYFETFYTLCWWSFSTLGTISLAQFRGNLKPSCMNFSHQTFI